MLWTICLWNGAISFALPQKTEDGANRWMRAGAVASHGDLETCTGLQGQRRICCQQPWSDASGCPGNMCSCHPTVWLNMYVDTHSTTSLHAGTADHPAFSDFSGWENPHCFSVPRVHTLYTCTMAHWLLASQVFKVWTDPDTSTRSSVYSADLPYCQLQLQLQFLHISRSAL